MKIGTTIQNGDMTLTVVAYHENKKGNVALLVQQDDPCPYLTVIDLTRHKDGKYHWYFAQKTLRRQYKIILTANLNVYNPKSKNYM